MKLFLCATCTQIFNLTRTYQECKGGHGGGQYIDNLNAKIWGPKEKIFVLGFANSSFVDALREQVNYGDRLPQHLPGYGFTAPGREFTSFIIPDMATSVERVDNRFTPVDATAQT